MTVGTALSERGCLLVTCWVVLVGPDLIQAQDSGIARSAAFGALPDVALQTVTVLSRPGK